MMLGPCEGPSLMVPPPPGGSAVPPGPFGPVDVMPGPAGESLLHPANKNEVAKTIAARVTRAVLIEPIGTDLAEKMLRLKCARRRGAMTPAQLQSARRRHRCLDMAHVIQMSVATSGSTFRTLGLLGHGSY